MRFLLGVEESVRSWLTAFDLKRDPNRQRLNLVSCRINIIVNEEPKLRTAHVKTVPRFVILSASVFWQYNIMQHITLTISVVRHMEN